MQFAETSKENVLEDHDSVLDKPNLGNPIIREEFQKSAF